MMKITGEGGEPKRALMGYDEARSRQVLARHRFLAPAPAPKEEAAAATAEAEKVKLPTTEAAETGT